jgi:hypothetical protein
MQLVENAAAPSDSKIVVMPFDWNGTVEEAFYCHYFPLFLKMSKEQGIDLTANWPANVKTKVQTMMRDESALKKKMQETAPPTPEDEERIYAAKIRIKRKNSVLGEILDNAPTIYVGPSNKGGVDTFAIDSYGNLLINLGFSKTLDEEELEAVLAHEALHIALEHHLRVKGRLPWVFANYAMDAIINGGLTMDGFKLPAGGVQTGRYDRKVWFWLLVVDHDIPDIKVANPKLLHVDIVMHRRGWEEVFDELKSYLEPDKQAEKRAWFVNDVVFDKVRKKYGVITHKYGEGSYIISDITQQQAEALLRAKKKI